ncbi:Receptor-like cytoplasmic kinase 176 [Glycine max]|nr:Receptor-like cytoplasmic kinase 176 [Glycine max]
MAKLEGELKSATNNFRPDTVVSEGGLKGWLDEDTLAPAKAGSRMVVAITKFNSLSMKSELNFLGRLSHPNLVKLLGYCWEDDDFFVVHEFTPMGSLENHLFDRNPNFEPLPWDTRLNIAIGASRGLAFLQRFQGLK